MTYTAVPYTERLMIEKYLADAARAFLCPTKKNICIKSLRNRLKKYRR